MTHGRNGTCPENFEAKIILKNKCENRAQRLKTPQEVLLAGFWAICILEHVPFQDAPFLGHVQFRPCAILGASLQRKPFYML